MPTNDEEWNEQMQAEEDARAAFNDSGITVRTPAKKHNTPNLGLQAAPRKPAVKPMTEEREEPTTPTHTASDTSTKPIKQQNQENMATANEPQQTLPGSTMMIDSYNRNSPTKTLFDTALEMIKRTQAKLHPTNINSSGTVPRKVGEEVFRELGDIVTIMQSIHQIEDQMTSVKDELQSIKQSMTASEKAVTRTEEAAKRTWAAVTAPPRPTLNPANPSLRIANKPADEEPQHRLTQRRLENAKLEITLSGTSKDTQNQIASNSHAEVTKKLQAAVQKATTVELRPTIRGVQKLKSNDI